MSVYYQDYFSHTVGIVVTYVFIFYYLFIFSPACMVSDWARKGKLVSLTVCLLLYTFGNHHMRLMAALWARIAIKPLTSAISPDIL